MDITLESKVHGEKVFCIDDEDFHLIEPYTWNLLKGRGTFYVHTTTVQPPITMHRLLMGFPDGKQIDHIDHNGLNNRRSNLRIATPQQNGANQQIRASNFKGVSYDKNRDRFTAQIMVNYKGIHLGRFHSPEEAAIAYNKAALQYFGEYAFLNNIENVYHQYDTTNLSFEDKLSANQLCTQISKLDEFKNRWFNCFNTERWETLPDVYTKIVKTIDDEIGLRQSKIDLILKTRS